MLRISFVVFLFVLVSGCGSGVGRATGGQGTGATVGTQTNANNWTGEDFCLAFGLNWAAMNDFYYAALTDRDNGFTYEEEIGIARENCFDVCRGEISGCASTCGACMEYLINLAYFP